MNAARLDDADATSEGCQSGLSSIGANSKYPGRSLRPLDLQPVARGLGAQRPGLEADDLLGVDGDEPPAHRRAGLHVLLVEEQEAVVDEVLTGGDVAQRNLDLHWAPRLPVDARRLEAQPGLKLGREHAD